MEPHVAICHFNKSNNNTVAYGPEFVLSNSNKNYARRGRTNLLVWLLIRLIVVVDEEVD